jgi:hypothetical protein
MNPGSFITDRRTLAALLAIDDIIPSLLIAASDPGRLYLIGTPWRLYLILNGEVSVWCVARAFEWVDSIEAVAALPKTPYVAMFDRRVYPRGFFALGAREAVSGGEEGQGRGSRKSACRGKGSK